MNIRLRAAAERELRRALEWYAAKREGLDDAFLSMITATLERVQATPQAFRIVAEREGLVRAARVRRFPYSVVYVVIGESIHVIAFAHSRRRSEYWRARV